MICESPKHIPISVQMTRYYCSTKSELFFWLVFCLNDSNYPKKNKLLVRKRFVEQNSCYCSATSFDDPKRSRLKHLTFEFSIFSLAYSFCFGLL